MSKAQELAKMINKEFGTNTVRMGSDSTLEVKYVSTGLTPFDVWLGGGWARGRFIQITGNYSTLKSYIALHAIAEVQRQNGVAALIDTEHAFDPDWATVIGVDVDKLILQQPATGEEAIDIAQVLVANEIDLIVFDSIAATLPQQEANKRLSKENIQPARLAALMSAACRRLTAANRRTAIIWVNQLREQVGVTFGPTEKATGGRAMGYYASTIVNIRKVGSEFETVTTDDGNKTVKSKRLLFQSFKATLEKSKLSAPWTELFFDFNLVMGGEIDVVKYVFAQCVDLSIIKQEGRSWVYEKVRAVGREAFLRRMTEDTQLLMTLENLVREANSLPPSSSPHGKSTHRSRKVAASSGSSRKKGARGSTRTAVQAASNGTRRMKKTS